MRPSGTRPSRPPTLLQGPHAPWGGACAVSGQSGRGGRPRRAARAGRSLGLRARARGRARARRRAASRSSPPTARRTRTPAGLPGTGVELRLGTEEAVAAGRCRARGQEPGCAGALAARRGCARTWHPDLERGRARLPAAPGQPADRRHRHERQDDDVRAARRDVRARPGGASRSPATSAAPSARSPSRSSRTRGSSASSRASSSRTCTTLACDVAVLLNLEPDHLDRHGTFEAYRDAKLRIFERARDEDRAARLSSRASSSRPTTRCRQSRVMPGRAQPRERRRRDRRRARGRHRRRRDRGGAAHVRGRAAPARARSRAARRALRQRLEGDERGRGATRRLPRTTRRSV